MKAYDLVEWSFLRRMALCLGFPNQWASTVMTCVESTTFSLLITCVLWQKFSLTRGIHSLFLFLFCTEGLLEIMMQAEWKGWIEGMAVSHSSQSISHMFFADGSLVFLWNYQYSETSLKDILQFYPAAFGQRLNLAKSAIHFSPSIDTIIYPIWCHNDQKYSIELPFYATHFYKGNDG